MDFKSDSQKPEPVAERERFQSQESREQMEGSWQRWTMQRSQAPFRMEEIDVKVWLERCEVVRPDCLEQPARLVITTHHEMLTVVDFFGGLAVNERICPAAQVLASFKEENGVSAGREVNSGAQSADAATDHDDIGACGVHWDFEVRIVKFDLHIENFEFARRGSFRAES
jgi:hypothetical protein